MGREKKKVVQVASYENRARSPFLYLALWLAMYLFEIAIFEVDASLKWIPL